ncbi:MAG: hypothetical protein JSU06_06725 [Actinobacteria bacterium]|nr:hypothetical protein [Actinomycetota bacterium]
MSGFGGDAMTPRGQRTQQLIKALEGDWEVELISMPAQGHRGGGGTTGRSLARQVASWTVQQTLFDRWEPWSRRRFSGWRPQADAAVLIVAPWSLAARAAPRLRTAGVPYVIDAGDPWAVGLAQRERTIAARRGLRAERPIWDGAAGAVLTTPQQAARMQAKYPGLAILARPNGFEAPAEAAAPAARPAPDPAVLRLVHLGVIYAARLDPMPLLVRLRDSGRWKTIRFDQFGADPEGMLADAPAGIDVRNHTAIPWAEVVARTGEFDAAVVLGNELGELLPSKAIQYLTLPVPRIAVTDTSRDDALTDFARDHTAWLAVAPGDPDAARLIAEHVEHPWTAAELAPPPADSWATVGRELAAFVERCVAVGAPRPTAAR